MIRRDDVQRVWIVFAIETDGRGYEQTNIIGVFSNKLAAQKLADITGTIPEEHVIDPFSHEALFEKELNDRIKKTPGVCGGEACIRDTRIPVWLIREMEYKQISHAEMLDQYPGLSIEDLEAAHEYSLMFQEEIDKAIQENDIDDLKPDECS